MVALACDPPLIFEQCGLSPDPWQSELLRSQAPRVLLNCCRQAGKSTAVAALALHTALFTPRSLVLLLSGTQRQSGELFRKVLGFYDALGEPVPAIARTTLTLELANGSRIVSLPGNGENVRSFSGVRLLVIDEAARVDEELYRAVRPMLAVSGGRLVCLSTPAGKRGFFYNAWQDQATPWLRIEINGRQVPRISPAHLAEELHNLGPTWFNQEYNCSFETPQGLVYPDFPCCLVSALPEELRVPEEERRMNVRRRYPRSSVLHPESSRRVGGIDFGFDDPFAAVWGILDKDNVLWLTGEHYGNRRPVQDHAASIPRTVFWYADPAGAEHISVLKRADFKVAKAKNALEPGIDAVTYRIRAGKLKVLCSACPNLVTEAGLYRYPTDEEQPCGKKKPVDRDNHALDALRYLVMGLPNPKSVVRSP
jgi:hypothetical protein